VRGLARALQELARGPARAAGARGGLAVVLLNLCAAAPAAAELTAGAASVEVALPSGTPLAGYGGFPRRAWIPDVIDRRPHAFWLKPSEGVHDPLMVRALELASGETRVLWLAVDLVGIDPSLVGELRERLDRAGQGPSALIVSASHTHSGPGAFAHSALFGFLAIDRPSAGVRARILDGLARAAQEAHARRVPALVGAGRARVTGVAKSRLRAPLDPELGVLKVVSREGRPVALLWNYAVHGTALGKDNFLLSGDLMAEASARIERALEAPALFVNGAVGDVSPARRGREGARSMGEALAGGALGAWGQIKVEPDARLAAMTERVGVGAPALRIRNCVGRWVPRWLSLGLGWALPRSSEMVAVAVGRSAWVTVPGELETRLGLTLKAAVPRPLEHVFVAGVSNDYLGYFLTAAAYDRPSYIACGSLYGEGSGEAMSATAAALLSRLAASLSPEAPVASAPR